MKYRTMRFIGGEENVSLLGLGCMRFPLNEDGTIDEAQAEAMIGRALNAGINYIDTAYPYHKGESEPFLGRALKKYPRNRFYPYYSEEAWPHTSRLLEAMRDVAARNNCRVVDVAVGWVLAQRGVTLALVGARTEEQARMNAMAGDFVMPEEDEKMLGEVSAEVLAALNF